MTMKDALFISQIVISALLIISILLQRGESGLGTVFGGSVSEAYRTKRGFEAFIYNLTIFLTVLFIGNAVAIAILSS
jgi:protein translocase SecG subunit